MSGFFMMAGTVNSERPLQLLAGLLVEAGIDGSIDDDEFVMQSPTSTLALRTGFDHEYIAVGDAEDEIGLLADCTRLSRILKEREITHELEIYDKENRLIEQFVFQDD
jgi:hypothetical protein